MTRQPLLLAAALALGLSAGTAQAQMVVHDPTNYAKILQQAQTALDQLNELKTEVLQGKQLFDSLNTASGVGDIAAELGLPNLREVIPDVSKLTTISGGDLSALGAIGERAGAIRDAQRLFSFDAATPRGAEFEAAGQRIARDLALGEAVSTAGAERLQGLKAINAAIDSAPNARAVLDLQARAAAEQAMIANDQMRLQGIAMAQAAEDRLQRQRDLERMAAGRASRIALYRSAFQ
jgi:type IV secretion system protein VirB5